MLFIKSNIAYLFNKFFNEININKLMTIYCILNKYFKVDVKLFIIISNIIKNFSNFFGLELIVFNYFFLINKLNLNLLDFKSNVSNSKILYLNNFIKSNLTLQNYKIVKLVSDIAQDVSSKFYIRFSPSTTTKYLLNTFLQSIDVLYLRKNKVFNKGRYSRNRQFYRTGVY